MPQFYRIFTLCEKAQSQPNARRQRPVPRNAENGLGADQ
jgi:hypothetical protein